MRTWPRVFDNPRQLLSPSNPDVLAPPSTRCSRQSNGFPGKSLRSARAPARRHPIIALQRVERHPLACHASPFLFLEVTFAGEPVSKEMLR